MSEFVDLVRRPPNNNGNKNEVKYDPRCGMSKEVFEWQRRQRERVSNRTPEVMRRMRVLTQKMRSNFQDDPEGLKKWEDYEKDVLYAYQCNLPICLSSPAMIPYTILYKKSMLRTAHSKPPLGMLSGKLYKLKQVKNNRFLLTGAIAVSAAAVGFAFVYAYSPTITKQHETK
ncbi:hypothetical protein QOZ80_4AG0327130 [Eleusine coracana subsp. coracana]|nr:hypothetical protein QOZ80_4AG0327130 [Eleusine coracana subsp. coracana]